MSKSIHVGLAHSLIALESMSEEEQALVKEIKNEIQAASGVKRKKRKYTKRKKTEEPAPEPEKKALGPAKKIVKKAPTVVKKKAPVVVKKQIAGAPIVEEEEEED